MIGFRKVHGAGNDFILVTDPQDARDWGKLARTIAAGGSASAVTDWSSASACRLRRMP